MMGPIQRYLTIFLILLDNPGITQWAWELKNSALGGAIEQPDYLMLTRTIVPVSCKPAVTTIRVGELIPT